MRERVGRYQLLDRIGAGGMGVVWRAIDDEGRHVALKTLRAHDAEMRRALLREIAGLARLRHPGIAGFVDHGEHEGHPFYAMTWIDGAPLDLRGGTAVTVAYDDTWDRATPAIAEQPDLQTVLTVFHRLCGTLAWLHGEGIVHRDLKPDNVLVGLDGWPVLVDFGLAGRFAGGRSREAAADGIVRAGTPGLIAPEQRRGALVDARADLYSLGCMLYLGLTGELPPDPYQTVPRPSDAARDVPPALDDLVARLLARRPEDRPGHAEDVACVLAELGADPAPWPSAPPARPWVYRPRLAGREAELDAIDHIVAEARGVLLLHGPAGAGRSRLVLEAAARAWAARRRPIVVATGGAELTSALGTLVERLEADDVVDRLDPVVGRMFPALERHLGPAGREPTLERVVSATLALLALLAEAKPLVLAIDDLDAADELTVALVTRIHREEPARIGVVASVRDPSGLPVELAGGARVLGELDGIAVAAMVRDMLAVPEVDEASAARLAERTRGRPLLVVEALRTGVHLGLLTRRGGRWRLSRPIEELLPREERGDVATALFLQRVAQVAPEARELLSVAAVAGEAVDLDLLCELLPGTPVDAVAAELVRGGLLDADGPVVRFVHSSLREALARAVPEPRRTELHGRIADRLSDPGMRAEHLARAGRVSEAVTACREAATAARRRGLVLTEVEALTAATALAGSVAPDLAYDLVKAEVAAGRMDDAARHAREALDGLAPESPWRVQLMQALAFAQLRVGRVEALDIAREAVRLARASGVQVSSALATLGFVAWSRGELEEARAALDEALGVESDPQRLAGILLNLSGLLAMERKRTEATACLHRALGLRPHEHHLGPLYTNLAAMQVWGGELEAARRSLASAEEADAACGDLYGTLSTHLLEARVEILAGRPAVADVIVGHTLSRARALRMPVLVREALLLSAELRLDEDDIEAAGRALEELLEDPVESLVGASLLESRRRRRLGDLAGARRALDAAGPIDALLGDSRPLAAMEAVHLARAEGRDGAVELDHLHRILASFPDPIHPDSVVGRALAALDS